MPKHHYVPRMLLKYFSTDTNSNFINIHLLKNDKFIYNASLYEQAQEENLYGSDQKLECFYGKLESAASICLNKLNLGNIDLTKEEQWHLKLFVINQLSRTPGFISIQDNCIEKLVKKMASHDKYMRDHIEDFSVALNKPYNMYSSFSIDLLFLLLDLSIGLIETDNRKSFIIGKNPVIILNPFLKEKKNWIWSTQGLALKGLLIILPISPRFSLLLYDGLRYKLLIKKHERIINVSDVDKLNSFQYCSTNECIYFKYSINEKEFERMNSLYKNFRESNKSDFEVIGSSIDEKTGYKTEITRTGTKEFPVEQKFGFIAFKATEYGKPINNYNDAKRENVDDVNLWRKNRLYKIKKDNGII